MAFGKMIRLMDMVNILTLMALSMRGIGLMISSMVLERNTGLMVLNTKETINMVKRMVTVNSYGQINLHIVVTLLTIIFMGRGDTGGLMVVNIAEIGNAIKCTAKEFLRGQMVVNMMDNTLMTRNRVMVFLPGLTDVSTMVTG